MASYFTSALYYRLMSAMIPLAARNLSKCCSLPVCPACRLAAYYFRYQARTTGQPVRPIFYP